VPRKSDPGIERLRALFDHCPETGRLFWKGRPGHPKEWNVRWSGKEAFTALTSAGYRHGRIDRTAYYAHHVIFALATGRWPIQIDHINGDRADNRLCNLREVEQRANCRNQKRRRDLPLGVSVNSTGTRWRARISVRENGARQQIYLGSFRTLEAATAVRKAAEANLGYHPNHGEK
jgi:hypothetical protein